MLVQFYAIRFKTTDQVYVGSTINFPVRKKKHLYDLRRCRHHAVLLQRLWSENSESDFSFEILQKEECADEYDRAAIELSLVIEIGTLNTSKEISLNQFLPISNAKKILRSLANKTKAAEDSSYREFLSSRGDALRKFMKSEEGRKNMSTHTIRRWQDPEERKKLAMGLINRWADPAARERQSKALINSWTEERKKKNSDILKKRWKDPAYKETISKRRKEKWSDPEFRAKMHESRKAAWIKRREKYGIPAKT